MSYLFCDINRGQFFYSTVPIYMFISINDCWYGTDTDTIYQDIYRPKHTLYRLIENMQTIFTLFEDVYFNWKFTSGDALNVDVNAWLLTMWII